MKLRTNCYFALVGVLAIPAVLACSSNPKTSDDAVSAALKCANAECGGDPRYIDVGLPIDVRDEYHYKTQGSRLVPYQWLLALEQDTNDAAFLERRNVRRYGFLPDKPSDPNPDGLPVGFARDDDPNTGAWAGFTCAACHTGLYAYQGTTFRVDGSQGRDDIGEFLLGLSRALTATATDDAKFSRFADNVVGTDGDAAALRSELTAFATKFDTMAHQTAGPHRLGPGRADSLNAVFNAVACRAIGVSGNCEDAVAATAMPPLWLTSDLDWVQTDGNQHIPLVRDMLQAFIFADVSLQGANVQHSVNLPNLKQIEDTIATMHAPKWPEDIFGWIDQEKAQAGQTLYQANCASCHALAPYPMTDANPYGKQFIQIKRVPAAEIGVDPQYITSFLARRSDPGPLASAVTVESDGKVPSTTIASLVAKGALATSFAALGLGPAQQLELMSGRESKTLTPADLQSFVARPLPGVALSGYYLHNGSVRTIYQLLLPPAQREKSFYVGTIQYDPVHLGFESDPKVPNAYLFDSSNLGDSNAGHDYGTNLSDDERYQLLEFLKTL